MPLRIRNSALRRSHRRRQRLRHRPLQGKLLLQLLSNTTLSQSLVVLWVEFLASSSRFQSSLSPDEGRSLFGPCALNLRHVPREKPSRNKPEAAKYGEWVFWFRHLSTEGHPCRNTDVISSSPCRAHPPRPTDPSTLEQTLALASPSQQLLFTSPLSHRLCLVSNLLFSKNLVSSTKHTIIPTGTSFSTTTTLSHCVYPWARLRWWSRDHALLAPEQVNIDLRIPFHLSPRHGQRQD